MWLPSSSCVIFGLRYKVGCEDQLCPFAYEYVSSQYHQLKRFALYSLAYLLKITGLVQKKRKKEKTVMGLKVYFSAVCTVLINVAFYKFESESVSPTVLFFYKIVLPAQGACISL